MPPRSYHPDRAATGAERKRRYDARKRAASFERINEAPCTRHEKLAKMSLGVEQFAGAWERRFAQQCTTLLTAEEQDPAVELDWAVIEPDVPPEPGFSEEFEEIDLKEDAPVPEGAEWVDAAWQAQAEAESAARQAIEEDALALKKQRRKEREGSVPGAESVELLFNRGLWQYAPKRRRVRRVPATDEGRHIPVTRELAAKALALSAGIGWLYCRHSLPIPHSDWAKFAPRGNLLPVKQINTWSGNAVAEAEAISRAAALQQTDGVTPGKNDPPDVVADLLAEREQMVDETDLCLKRRLARDPYVEPSDVHRIHAARSPEVNAQLLQPESDAVPVEVISEEDKLPEDREFILDLRKEHAKALEAEREAIVFFFGLNDPEAIQQKLDASNTDNDPEILQRELDALDFESERKQGEG